MADWTPLERWVWERLRAGEFADIDQYCGDAGPLPPADPKTPEDWLGGDRRLTPEFLSDILLRNPWRGELQRQGVRIYGGWFDETVDLQGARLEHELWVSIGVEF